MPSEAPARAAARRLLAEVIDSFEKLEIVVHAHRTGYTSLSPTAIANATSIAPDEVDRCLGQLDRARVLDAAGPWADAVAELVAMYDEDRIEVLDLMTQNSLERVRRQAARVFADAFVIRRKKKRDPDA